MVNTTERKGDDLITSSQPELFGWRVGDEHEFTREVTEDLVEAFANVSGDFNRLHLDTPYAEQTRFCRRIAHGMLVGSFISAALSQMGRNRATGIYLRQELDFIRVVHIGDVVIVRLKVLSLELDQNKLIIDTPAYNQREKLVVRGQAVALLDPYPYIKAALA